MQNDGECFNQTKVNQNKWSHLDMKESYGVPTGKLNLWNGYNSLTNRLYTVRREVVYKRDYCKWAWALLDREACAWVLHIEGYKRNFRARAWLKGTISELT